MGSSPTALIFFGFHLTDVPGRQPHVEIALLKHTHISPAFLIFLAGCSAASGTAVLVGGKTSAPSRASGPPTTFVGAGDIARCDSDGDEATARLLDSFPDATVFTLGDNAYGAGTTDEYQQCYEPSWGRHKARTRPAPGNHEYVTEGASGYYAYFGAQAGDPTKGYYSYDLGDWHVVALNSNVPMAAGAPQEQWLRADLAASRRPCLLAYWHAPRFSSSVHGNALETGPLWQALYDARADVILGGHDHSYERFARQTPAGAADSVHGIREFVVGTGGASHYGQGMRQPNSERFDSTTFGVLKLTLGSADYAWEFVPVAGGTFRDAGKDRCGAKPSDRNP